VSGYGKQGKMQDMRRKNHHSYSKKLTKHHGKNNYTGSLNTQARIGANYLSEEPVSKCSILFKVKKCENFNRRNILNISRIKI
jgi:hypothetical protein